MWRRNYITLNTLPVMLAEFCPTVERVIKGFTEKAVPVLLFYPRPDSSFNAVSI